jgi:hypothetical protein
VVAMVSIPVEIVLNAALGRKPRPLDSEALSPLMESAMEVFVLPLIIES